MHPSIQPDEWIWGNMGYDIFNQTRRRYLANIGSILIVIGITIYEIYTGTLKDAIDEAI